ncbi:MAG: hypothetical protein JXA11_15425 [Phycisphaerae bacterium]|nr:hypothetical protein [Phycisphaerae bacterium]
MTCITDILMTLPSFLAKTSAMERWRGARTTPTAGQGWSWMLAMLLLLLGVVLAVSLVLYYRKRMSSDGEGADEMISRPSSPHRSRKRKRSAGALTSEDVSLLTRLLRMSGFVKSDMEFTLSHGLAVGKANYLGSDEFLELSGQQREALEESIEDLQHKLGAEQEDQGGKTITTREIPVGAYIMVTHAGVDADLEMVVQANSREGLRVQPPFPVESPSEATWILRYFDGVRVWGFTSPVLKNEGKILLLAHTDKMDMVNFRRFARVPVKIPARVSRFLFQTSTQTDPQPMEFVPSDVVEIGGPGVLLHTALKLRVGERIVLCLDFDANGVIQSVGKVRRENLPDPMTNRNVYGVELVGLKPSQAAELMHVTNAAAIELRKEKQNESKKTLQTATNLATA